VAAFRATLGTQVAQRQEDLGGRTLTVVEKQDLWGMPDLRPSKVMVWTPTDTGAFLDFITRERLSALYTLTAYCGLRRDEVLGSRWTEVDLDEGSADVVETGNGNGPKSESGKRTVPLPAPVTDAPRRHQPGEGRQPRHKASQCQQRPAQDTLTSVRALCVHPVPETRTGTLREHRSNGKCLLRGRRIGDLNPGWCYHQTALAVRRHRPD
jgi:integrase